MCSGIFTDKVDLQVTIYLADQMNENEKYLNQSIFSALCRPKKIIKSTSYNLKGNLKMKNYYMQMINIKTQLWVIEIFRLVPYLHKYNMFYNNSSRQ